jgi:hypothetical protein
VVANFRRSLARVRVARWVHEFSTIAAMVKRPERGEASGAGAVNGSLAESR